MASLEKRGNGSWRVTISSGYDSTGHKRFIKRTIKVDPKKTELAQRREAEKQASIIEADYRRHLITASKRLTLSALADEYLKTKDITETTKNHYRFLLRSRILPALGTMAVQDITPRDIQQFYQSLSKANALSHRSKSGKLSGTSQLHYHRCLHAILSYAVRTCIISINPADSVEPPRKDTPETAFYEIEDCVKLLKALDDQPDLQWRLFFNLALYTGCRPGELIALNWSDIDNDILYIRAGSEYIKGAHGAVRTNKPKTLKSIRKITLPPEVVKLLRMHRAEQAEYRLKFGSDWPEPDAVFTGDLGYRLNISSPTQKFQKIIKQYNLKHITLYGLRHTAGSILIAQGLDVRRVSEFLGHSQVSTTLNIYTHAFQDSSRKAMAAISSAIDDAKHGVK